MNKLLIVFALVALCNAFLTNAMLETKDVDTDVETERLSRKIRRLSKKVCRARGKAAKNAWKVVNLRMKRCNKVRVTSLRRRCQSSLRPQIVARQNALRGVALCGKSAVVARPKPCFKRFRLTRCPNGKFRRPNPFNKCALMPCVGPVKPAKRCPAPTVKKCGKRRGLFRRRRKLQTRTPATDCRWTSCGKRPMCSGHKIKVRRCKNGAIVHRNPLKRCGFNSCPRKIGGKKCRFPLFKARRGLLGWGKLKKSWRTMRCPGGIVVRRAKKFCGFPKCPNACARFRPGVKRCGNGRFVKRNRLLGCKFNRCSGVNVIKPKFCSKAKKRCPNGRIVSRLRRLKCRFPSCKNTRPKVCRQRPKRCANGRFVRPNPYNKCRYHSCNYIGPIGPNPPIIRNCGYQTRTCANGRKVRKNPFKNCRWNSCSGNSGPIIRQCDKESRKCSGTGKIVHRNPANGCLFDPCVGPIIDPPVTTEPVPGQGQTGPPLVPGEPQTGNPGFVPGQPQTQPTFPGQAQQGGINSNALPAGCAENQSQNCLSGCPTDTICCSGQCYKNPNSDSEFPLVPVLIASGVVLVLLLGAIMYCSSNKSGGGHQGGMQYNDFDNWSQNPSLSGGTQNAYHL